MFWVAGWPEFLPPAGGMTREATAASRDTSPGSGCQGGGTEQNLERRGGLYAGLGRKPPAPPPDPDLRLQPPELGDVSFLLCKARSLWHWVTLPKDTNPRGSSLLCPRMPLVAGRHGIDVFPSLKRKAWLCGAVPRPAARVLPLRRWRAPAGAARSPQASGLPF